MLLVLPYYRSNSNNRNLSLNKFALIFFLIKLCLNVIEKTPPPPAPAPHRLLQNEKSNDVEAAIKDIRLTLQRTKTLPLKCHPKEESEENAVSPIWVPR